MLNQIIMLMVILGFRLPHIGKLKQINIIANTYLRLYYIQPSNIER